MDKILYWLLKPLAILPLSLLYVFSDIVFFFLYHIIRYRRRVVEDNLRKTFTDKNDEERRTIARQFYRNFADYIFETIKLLHISDREISRRMVFDDTSVLDDLAANGTSVAVYFSHCGNWEWAPSITLHSHPEGVDVDYCQIYRPLVNAAFDSLMLRVRSRFGSISIAKSNTLRKLLELKREGKVTVTGFMSDQKPSHGDPTLPLMFLGRPTAFITGTETLARKLKMGAIYWDMYKESRGHYRIVTRLIASNVAETEQGSVTRTYASMLEKTILRNPSIWLWTHKRWKKPVMIPG